MPRPPEPEGDAQDALGRLVRDEGVRVLATLVRTTGSLAVAEDAVADAIVRALERWPTDGVPPEPRAWLTLVARRRATDVLRREALRGEKERRAAESWAATCDEPLAEEDEIRDDLLRLLFTCCHPSLDPPSQVALALRTLCGLSTAEVGRALLVSEQTMAKRLTRIRQKIAVAAIPYRVPAPADLPPRLGGVLATIYLLFNEGYSASTGDAAIRPDLTAAALRLGRLTRTLLPHEPGPLGLLALMLLQDARTPARLDVDGGLVLLAEQDRSRWNRTKAHEGMLLLGEALRRAADPDPYVVQAAIAGCHVAAPSWDQTNWDSIVSWYDVLLRVHDTPVVRLNRAVAIGELRGPSAGLAELATVQAQLEGYGLAVAARAELLLRAGRREDAAEAFTAALGHPSNGALSRHLRRRLDEATGAPDEARI